MILKPSRGEQALQSLLIPLLLLALTATQIPSGTASPGVSSLPFEGMEMVYEVYFPLLSFETPTSFTGLLSFTFTEVEESTAEVLIVLNGTLRVEEESEKLVYSDTSTVPLDKDTLLFLRTDTDPTSGSVTISSIPLTIAGWRIMIEGVFDYEGEMPISVPAGDYATYRMHNSTSQLGLTTDIYLHYENQMKIMVYGELNLKASFLTYKYTLKLRETNIQFPPPETRGPQCLIATAAYGSPMAPEVQGLRGFRDNLVMRTQSGRAFMEAFNQWYYSFSPGIAVIVERSPPARALTRTLLRPLITILKVSETTYSSFSFNDELGVLAAGAVASILLGAVYVTPLITLVLILVQERSGKRLGVKGIALGCLGAVGISLTATLLGAFTNHPWILKASTPALVLSLMASTSILASASILKGVNRILPGPRGS